MRFFTANLQVIFRTCMHQDLPASQKKPRIAGFEYGGGAGIRTLGAFTLNGFQDRRFRPLSHPSKLGRDYIELLQFRATNIFDRRLFYLFIYKLVSFSPSLAIAILSLLAQAAWVV